MKTVLVIPQIKVERANAIAGITWGFPAVSNFLGCAHRLSRALNDFAHTINKHYSLQLGGCAIVCHEFQTHTTQARTGAEHYFSLTRNPLNKSGATRAFNEEGKISFRCSLIIECQFSLDDDVFDDMSEQTLKTRIQEQLYQQKLAGGLITSIGDVQLLSLNTDAQVRQQQVRKLAMQLLPGYLLMDRSYLLAQYQATQADDFEAFMDCVSLRSVAHVIDKQSAKAQADTTPDIQWHYQQKPLSGWLVPMHVGYKGLTKLFEPGAIEQARDVSVPFRFAEAVYSIGQWQGVHRLAQLDQLQDALWFYDYKDDWYLCRQHRITA